MWRKKSTIHSAEEINKTKPRSAFQEINEQNNEDVDDEVQVNYRGKSLADTLFGKSKPKEKTSQTPSQKSKSTSELFALRLKPKRTDNSESISDVVEDNSSAPIPIDHGEEAAVPTPAASQAFGVASQLLFSPKDSQKLSLSANDDDDIEDVNGDDFGKFFGDLSPPKSSQPKRPSSLAAVSNTPVNATQMPKQSPPQKQMEIEKKKVPSKKPTLKKRSRKEMVETKPVEIDDDDIEEFEEETPVRRAAPTHHYQPASIKPLSVAPSVAEDDEIENVQASPSRTPTKKPTAHARTHPTFTPTSVRKTRKKLFSPSARQSLQVVDDDIQDDNMDIQEQETVSPPKPAEKQADPSADKPSGLGGGSWIQQMRTTQASFSSPARPVAPATTSIGGIKVKGTAKGYCSRLAATISSLRGEETIRNHFKERKSENINREDEQIAVVVISEYYDACYYGTECTIVSDDRYGQRVTILFTHAIREQLQLSVGSITRLLPPWQELSMSFHSNKSCLLVFFAERPQEDLSSLIPTTIQSFIQQQQTIEKKNDAAQPNNIADSMEKNSETLLDNNNAENNDQSTRQYVRVSALVQRIFTKKIFSSEDEKEARYDYHRIILQDVHTQKLCMLMVPVHRPDIFDELKEGSVYNLNSLLLHKKVLLRSTSKLYTYLSQFSDEVTDLYMLYTSSKTVAQTTEVESPLFSPRKDISICQTLKPNPARYTIRGQVVYAYFPDTPEGVCVLYLQDKESQQNRQYCKIIVENIEIIYHLCTSFDIDDPSEENKLGRLSIHDALSTGDPFVLYADQFSSVSDFEDTEGITESKRFQRLMIPAESAFSVEDIKLYDLVSVKGVLKSFIRKPGIDTPLIKACPKCTFKVGNSVNCRVCLEPCKPIWMLEAEFNFKPSGTTNTGNFSFILETDHDSLEHMVKMTLNCTGNETYEEAESSLCNRIKSIQAVVTKVEENCCRMKCIAPRNLSTKSMLHNSVRFLRS